eukprot:UN20630
MFDIIGVLDEYEEYMDRICGATGWTRLDIKKHMKQEEISTHRYDLTDEMMRDLKMSVDVDTLIYQHILKENHHKPFGSKNELLGITRNR